MNWELVTPSLFYFLPYYCVLISAVQPRLYLLPCFIQLVSAACIQLASSEPAFIICPFAFFLLHKIQAVTVTNVWWFCSLAEEYTDVRFFNESCSCASHTSAAGTSDFKGFIGTGPYALVVQTLALAVLHTGMKMLISYTVSCIGTLLRWGIIEQDIARQNCLHLRKTVSFDFVQCWHLESFHVDCYYIYIVLWSCL